MTRSNSAFQQSIKTISVATVSSMFVLSQTGCQLLKKKGKESKETESQTVASGKGSSKASSRPSARTSATTLARTVPSTSTTSKGNEPSTGKELAPTMRMPTKEESKVVVDRVLAEAVKPNTECSKLMSPQVRTAFEIANPEGGEVSSRKEAFVRLARCAEKQKYYFFMMSLADDIFRADKHAHPELLARAAMGLGNYAGAEKLLLASSKATPKDANVQLTLAKLTCKKHQWDACATSSTNAFTLASDKSSEDKQVAWRAQKYLARATINQGKLEEAGKAVEAMMKWGGSADDEKHLREDMLAAKSANAVIDVVTQNEAALGFYHLYDKVPEAGSLIRMTINNIDKEDRQMKVELEIPGISQKMTKTVAALKGKEAELAITPSLKTDFNISQMTAERSAQVDVKVSSGDKVIHEHSYPIKILPRNYLPRRRFIDKEKSIVRVMDNMLGAWITPNAKKIDAFLAKAKERVRGKQFVGEQGPTLPQVQAIFDELKARGISYVMDPMVSADELIVQRTRLPTEVLESTNAQCLEGTLLYATLFESIGLHPVIVRVPGHAFVGWKPSKFDRVPPNYPFPYFFLETTVTSMFPFEKAVDSGINKVIEHKSKFKMPKEFAAAAITEIPAMRTLGVQPQPHVDDN